MTSDSKKAGPTVLWRKVKGKKVKSNDGKDIGEIKEISDNFLRVEKGTLSKDKFWIPKYVVDAYDGKNLWLLMSQDEILGKYMYGTAPSSEQYAKDFETFKTTPYGKKASFPADLDQNVRVIEGKETATKPTPQEETETEYKNIRDIE
jgi:hypothetical protein